MSGLVTVYDIKQIIGTFGPIFFDGFADGDAISVEFDEDRETTNVGVDGNVVRVINNNRVATVTLRLQRGSPSAAALRAWKTAFAPPFDIAPLILKDLGALVVHQSMQAWPLEPPPAFGADSPVEEWRIKCANFDTLPLLPATG